MYSVTDKIKWCSASGNKEGAIVDIYIAKNGNNEFIPFLVIEYQPQVDRTTRVQMPATDEYLKMMKVEKVV